MAIYEINPRLDPRWDQFLKAHPRASIFHSRAWLEALNRTYGYESIAFTTSRPAEELKNGLVFCQIRSRLTGRRLVSLPFSDHCDVLMDGDAELHDLMAALRAQLADHGWRYIEIRPLHSIDGDASQFRESESFCFHELDLTPDIDALFRKFHKDSTQRKIRRAEREGLRIECGRSSALLDAFYHLQLLTRRRHQLPPQPRSWFRNLAEALGEAAKIRIAFKDDLPTAGILTLQFKDTLVYKYGGSDSGYNNLGGTQLLFWTAIQEAKTAGLRRFDLGRSDLDNEGLLTFKDRWGAARSKLTYRRYSSGLPQTPGKDWKLRIVQPILARAPDSFLSVVGSILYKHVG